MWSVFRKQRKGGMKKILGVTIALALAAGVVSATATQAQANYGTYGRMSYGRSYRNSRATRRMYYASVNSNGYYAAGNGMYYVGNGNGYVGRGGYGYAATNPTNVAWVGGAQAWQVSNSSGQVLVNWPYRGGTCNVRYAELGLGYFTQRTSGPCDDGQLWVRGLQPGQDYVFQVAQDNWDNWSSAAVARAW